MILIRFKDGEREYELEADADELPAVINALTNPRAKVYAECKPPYIPLKSYPKPIDSRKQGKEKIVDPDRPTCRNCNTKAFVNRKGLFKRKFGGVSLKYKCKKCNKSITISKSAMEVARDNPKEQVVREKREKKEKKELNEKHFSKDEARIDALCPKCDSNDIMLASKATLKNNVKREYYRCRTCNHNFNNKKDVEAGEEVKKEEADTGVLECPKCNEQSGFRELKREKKTYGDKVLYRCVECKHEFTELENNG